MLDMISDGRSACVLRSNMSTLMRRREHAKGREAPELPLLDNVSSIRWRYCIRTEVYGKPKVPEQYCGTLIDPSPTYDRHK